MGLNLFELEYRAYEGECLGVGRVGDGSWETLNARPRGMNSTQ